MQSDDPFDNDRSIDWEDDAGVNPYDPAAVTDDESREDGDQPQQRWWTVIAVPALALIGFLAFSTLLIGFWMFVIHGRFDRELLTDPAAMESIWQSRGALMTIIVLPQFLFLLLPTLLAAELSPVPTRQRLGLVRGHWPIWAWLAAAMATPLVGLVSTVVLGMFMEESENLKSMSTVFREHGESGFLIPLALMIGATPAICEELLFRGYVQTRLARTAGPAIGIFLSSVLFAAFHMDLVHSIAVLPLGLFLGYVSWRSGSIFPAMIAHFVNNVISVVAVVLAPQGETDVLSLPLAMISLSILGSGMIGVTAVIAASILFGRPSESPTVNQRVHNFRMN